MHGFAPDGRCQRKRRRSSEKDSGRPICEYEPHQTEIDALAAFGYLHVDVPPGPMGGGGMTPNYTAEQAFDMPALYYRLHQWALEQIAEYRAQKAKQGPKQGPRQR